MSNFFIGVVALLLGGFLALAFDKKFKVTVSSIFLALGSVFCLIPAVEVLTTGQNLVSELNFNPLFETVKFVIDPLSAFFIIVISLMSLMAVIYSKGYLKPYIEAKKSVNSHLVFLNTLIASMLAVVTCQNALMFLILWEIMSLSSFFLVIFENEKKEVIKAGVKYLVFMHISVLFIILAFVLCAINSGSLDFESFASVLQENVHLANLVFVLAFIGFGTKAGFVPFHNWLPDAHPAAPSHVSAIMSGVMIKTGIYGILRILSLIAIPSRILAYAVLIISVISALYGVLYAIGQHDLKRLLAYHSIENIGIIGIGIAIGMLGLSYNHPVVATLGFAGGILHILNHSIFKELLFLSAGSVYLKCHTRDIEILGGLIKKMPKTAALFLVASVAICGLPPFNGFVSEFLVYLAMVKGLLINNFFALIAVIFALSGLALVGTLAILCFTKAFSIIFLGMPRSETAQKPQSDAPLSMIIPMSLLGISTLLIGVFPQYMFEFILKPVNVVLPLNIQIAPIYSSIMQTISIVALSFVAFIIILLVIRFKLAKAQNAHCTWGCGYDKPNCHMQYSASSYASPLISVLKPLFKKVVDLEKPRHLFPKSAHFSMHIDDIEEAYFINPLVKFDEWFLTKFEAIQSGNIQSYIKYGLIFLVLIIIGSLFIG